jgi:hypothetical protein
MSKYWWLTHPAPSPETPPPILAPVSSASVMGEVEEEEPLRSANQVYEALSPQLSFAEKRKAMLDFRDSLEPGHAEIVVCNAILRIIKLEEDAAAARG